MKVTVRRSGGFANVAQTFSIDSEALDDASQDELAGAVDALEDATMGARHPDGYRYHVNVDGHEYEAPEGWITETLVRLGKK